MQVIRAKYLIKCDIPGCKNISKNMYVQGLEPRTTGLAICDNCIKEFNSKKYARKEK